MPGLIVEQPAPAAVKVRKPTKNEQRRAKKKQQKKDVPATPSAHEASPAVQEPSTLPPQQNEPEPVDDDEDADIAAFDLPPEDPLLTQFASVFKKFNEVRVDDTAEAEDPPDKPTLLENEDFIPDEDEEAGEAANKLSKKAAKKASKLSIAELKALVRKPDIVDWTDPSAADPKLLVNIKSARNVVPVPAHWALKREYLSSKRGVEKAGFALPKFIAETGISEMRDATLDKQADASLKSRQRERVAPKMGKLDIDYQKLYSAFFHRQTKPSLTRYGEVYYEGKEYETNLRHLRPGELSEELKEALNMPPGAPPPWLINMQKVGPPPSYPSLRVPGLNAAPPVGAGWGFQPGGYGKPPLDESGRPLWGGDVFGLGEVEKENEAQESVDKSLWGELQVFEEEEEAAADEEDEDEDGDDDEEGGKGTETPFGTGLETPGGITSTVPTDFGGIHSMGGEEFNLRKQRRGTETEDSVHPRSAGQVLQERSIRAEGFFGGEKAYNLGQQGMSGASAPPHIPVLGQDGGSGRKRKAGDLDVSVDPEALEREDRLSKDEVRRQYEAMERSAAAGSGWVGGGGGTVDQEDLSQMIAEESAKRRRRDEGRQEGGGGRGRGRGR
ncbi:hypothetical protein LTR56_017012 [Elasticomyces elasticus]|nr:hypothetical protein LTR56_017012 [Elasticomyces elasticus]